MPAVVSAERLQQANALRGISEAAGRIAGPPHTPVERRPFLEDLREGWDDFRSRTWLWTSVAGAALGNMLFAAYMVLGPFVADRELAHAGAWALIASAFGAGSLAGGLVVLRIDPPRPMLVGTLAVSLFTLPLAFLAIPTPAVVTAGACLFAGAGLMVSNKTTMQRHVPPAKLSRVTSYDWFGALAMQPIGLLIWGPIGAAVGAGTALWIAFAILLASVFALLAVREIRELPAFPSSEPATRARAGAAG